MSQKRISTMTRRRARAAFLWGAAAFLVTTLGQYLAAASGPMPDPNALPWAVGTVLTVIGALFVSRSLPVPPDGASRSIRAGHAVLSFLLSLFVVFGVAYSIPTFMYASSAPWNNITPGTQATVATIILGILAMGVLAVGLACVLIAFACTAVTSPGPASTEMADLPTGPSPAPGTHHVALPPARVPWLLSISLVLIAVLRSRRRG